MNIEIRDEIIERINNAFEDVPYPGDNNISVHERLDEYTGRHWKQLPLEFIVRHRSDLPLLTVEAFRFYLPAFLINALLYPQEVDTLVSNLIYNLASPEFVDGSDSAAYNYEVKRFKAQADVLSPQQREAIATFIQSFKQLYPNESWSVLKSEQERLDRATKFWLTL